MPNKYLSFILKSVDSDERWKKIKDDIKNIRKIKKSKKFSKEQMKSKSLVNQINYYNDVYYTCHQYKNLKPKYMAKHGIDLDVLDSLSSKEFKKLWKDTKICDCCSVKKSFARSFNAIWNSGIIYNTPAHTKRINQHQSDSSSSSDSERPIAKKKFKKKPATKNFIHKLLEKKIMAQFKKRPKPRARKPKLPKLTPAQKKYQRHLEQHYKRRVKPQAHHRPNAAERRQIRADKQYALQVEAQQEHDDRPPQNQNAMANAQPASAEDMAMIQAVG